MPIISHDGQRLFGLAWTFNLLPSESIQAIIWHTRPFASTFSDKNTFSKDDNNNRLCGYVLTGFIRSGNSVGEEQEIKHAQWELPKKYLYLQKYESQGQWQIPSWTTNKNITEPQIPQVTVFSEYRGKSDHIPIKILKYLMKGKKSNEGYYFVVSTTGLGRPSKEKVIKTQYIIIFTDHKVSQPLLSPLHFNLYLQIHVRWRTLLHHLTSTL